MRFFSRTMGFFSGTKKTALDWSGVEAAIGCEGPWGDHRWLTVNEFLLSILPKEGEVFDVNALKNKIFGEFVARLLRELATPIESGVATLYLHGGLTVQKNHHQLEHLKRVVDSFVRVYTQGVMYSEDRSLDYMEPLYLNCLAIQQSLPIVSDSYCFIQAPDSAAIRLELYGLVDSSRYGKLEIDLKKYQGRTVKVYECGGRIGDDKQAEFEALVASLAPRKDASHGGGGGGGGEGGAGGEDPAARDGEPGPGAGGEGGGQGAFHPASPRAAGKQKVDWGSLAFGDAATLAGTSPKEGDAAEVDALSRPGSEEHGGEDLDFGSSSGSANPPATALSQPLFAKKYAKNVMIVWMLGVPLMTVSGFVMVLQYLPATVSLYHLMLTACVTGLMVAAANGLVCSMFKVITKRMSWPRMIVGGMLALVSGAGLALALTGVMSASLMALPLLPAVWMACAAAVGAFSSLMGILPLETTPASAQGLQGAGWAAQRKPEEGVMRGADETLGAGQTLGDGPQPS